MKILLVQAPAISTSFVPLGPAYLKSFLRGSHNVEILDLNILYYNHEPRVWEEISSISFYIDPQLYYKIISSTLKDNPSQNFYSKFDKHIQKIANYSAKRIIRNYNFDLVGFSVHDGSILPGMVIAYQLKKLSPKTPVILGGPTFCNLSSLDIIPDFKDMKFWDAVVFGEGEETLLELAEKFEKDNLSKTKGAIVRAGDKILYGDERKELDINSLPYPDFDDYSFKYYSYPMTLPVLSSRGCIGRCAFCRERLFWKKYRKRKPEDVVLEIEDRIEKYGFRSFLFCDSLINGDYKWLESFCRLVIKKNLDINWDGNARISKLMDRRLLRLLKDAGCSRLKYGVESGSPKVLKNMKKGVKTNLIDRVIKNTSKEKIDVHTYMISNFPGETYSDILNTIKFIKKNLNYIDSLTFHNYNESIELRNGSEYEKRKLLRPNTLQFFSFINYLYLIGDFHNDYLKILISIYSKIVKYGNISELKSLEINGKIEENLYINLSLDKKSLQSAIEILKKIKPKNLTLSLSWNKTKISLLKGRVKELTDSLKKENINYQIMKPVLPCLYGRKRLKPCRVCFQYVNLTGLEIEKMIVKYRKKHEKSLPFKEFMKKFCRSRISSYCKKCKDFKEERCTGVCNNPKFKELTK